MLVSAGPVVTKLISDNIIIGGNLAKIMGTIDEAYEKEGDKQMSSVYKKKYLLSMEDSSFIKKPLMKFK